MKNHGLFFSIVLSLCACKSDKAITPQDYDGEYPYIKLTNEPISTYQPVFINSWQVPPTVPIATPIVATGQYSFMFKEHSWNHWPYINASFRLIDNPSLPLNQISDRILGVSFAAMSGYNCAMESVTFVVPAKLGNYRFGENIEFSSTNPNFQNSDCDAPKDKIIAQTSADNWVKITKIDTLSNQVQGSFDLSFTIAQKDTYYSVIYPTNIRMSGNFSGPFQRYK